MAGTTIGMDGLAVRQEIQAGRLSTTLATQAGSALNALLNANQL
jgi:hypothetical protein